MIPPRFLLAPAHPGRPDPKLQSLRFWCGKPVVSLEDRWWKMVKSSLNHRINLMNLTMNHLKTPISPHFHHISPHFTCYFTTFHHISPHFTCYFTTFHHISPVISPHFTTFHHISPVISPHFTTFHLLFHHISPVISPHFTTFHHISPVISPHFTCCFTCYFTTFHLLFHHISPHFTTFHLLFHHISPVISPHFTTFHLLFHLLFHHISPHFTCCFTCYFTTFHHISPVVSPVISCLSPQQFYFGGLTRSWPSAVGSSQELTEKLDKDRGITGAAEGGNVMGKDFLGSAMVWLRWFILGNIDHNSGLDHIHSGLIYISNIYIYIYWWLIIMFFFDHPFFVD